MIALLLTAMITAADAPSVEPQWLSDARPKSEPLRIVTVAPGLTELLFALGVGKRVVGVTRYDDYPAEVLALPKVGGFSDPNAEAILELEPDIVLAVPNAANRRPLERVAKLGVPVYVVPGNTFVDIFVAIESVGALLGGEPKKRADELAKRIRQKVSELEALTKNKPRTKALIVYSWNPLIVGGPKSFADRLIEVAGGFNVATVGADYPSYSVEHVLKTAPDVLLDATEVVIDEAPWKNWKSVPAVKNGRVHRVTMGGFMRPGPRVIEGLAKMYELLHPPAKRETKPATPR